MREYKYSEIGMLVGAATGGAVSVVCYSISGNILFFIAAGIGVAAGLITGNMLDKINLQKQDRGNN